MRHQRDAEVVELVDALDSKSSEGNLVRVRFPPSVPKLKFEKTWAFFNFMTMKKIAVIDLGTNGFRLQIAEVPTTEASHKAPSGQFHIVYKENDELKLATDGIYHIGKVPFERGLAAMRHFANVLKEKNVQNVKAFGTAVLRMADNGQDFIETVKHQTGIEIDLITGEREAELIYKGMKLGVPLNVRPDVMIDVGGGSVEFIICNTEGVLWAKSFNVGVAILKQNFHQNDPIIETEINSIENFLNENALELLEKIKEFQPKTPIFSCGTLDFIVKILRGGYSKPYLEIEQKTFFDFFKKWVFLSEKNLLEIPEIPNDKVEMLAVSLILMDWVMKKMNAHRLIASANSMKAGILYEMSL